MFSQKRLRKVEFLYKNICRKKYKFSIYLKFQPFSSFALIYKTITIQNSFMLMKYNENHYIN